MTVYRSRRILLAAILTLVCVFTAAVLPVSATESVSALKPFAKYGMSGATIVFSEEDLTENLLGPRELTGLLVTAVRCDGGEFLLDGASLTEGKVIEREHFAELSFLPVAETADATLDFLPIFAEGTAEITGNSSRITVSVGNERNFAPTAADLQISGYRNIDIPIALSAYDREDDRLTYTVVSAPSRGTLAVVDDTLIYSPAPDKSGKATFTYYASDSAGNTSELATVTIDIRRQTTDVWYDDLAGSKLQHAAITLAEEGIYCGRSIGGHRVFDADETVSRGECITLAAAALDFPLNASVSAALTEEQGWQSAYLAAAAEAEIITDARYDDAVTGAEAAAILARMMGVSATRISADGTVPTWASADVSALTEFGIMTDTSNLSQSITRGELAVWLANIAAIRQGDRLGWQTR